MLDMQRYLPLIALCVSFCLVGCSRNKAPSLRTYQMGERVEVGRLIYTAVETEWLTQVGEPPQVKVPKDRFYLIRVSIANSGANDQVSPALSLLDDNDNSHPELTDAQGVSNWIGAIRTIRPAEAAQGFAVFDVPPRHYRLRVADEDDQQAALIDIPLSFGSELPMPPADTPAGKTGSGGK